MRRWTIRLLFLVLFIFVLECGAFWALEVFPRYGSHPPLKLGHGTLAIEHARIYTSPTDPPTEDGTVLIHDGVIAAVGSQVTIPADATVLPCNHCVVTAGFWNAHVHFTEPKWNLAEWKADDLLNAQLADMFLSRGFTTVIDVGSNPADTFAIRRRIERVQLRGPYIYTSGPPLYPPHGLPFYIKDSAPGWQLALMSEPATPDAARRTVRRNLTSGADL